jgi:hypothetical protein
LASSKDCKILPPRAAELQLVSFLPLQKLWKSPKRSHFFDRFFFFFFRLEFIISYGNWMNERMTGWMNAVLDGWMNK